MLYAEITWDDETWVERRFRDFQQLAAWLTDRWNEGKRVERIDFPAFPPPARPPRGCDFLPYGHRLREGDFVWYYGRRGRWHPVTAGSTWVGYGHHFGVGDPDVERHGQFAARRKGT